MGAGVARLTRVPWAARRFPWRPACRRPDRTGVLFSIRAVPARRLRPGPEQQIAAEYKTI